MSSEASTEPYTKGARVALVCVWANGALSAAKLTAGLLGGSLGLVADGINNLGDVFTSSFIWLGMKVGRQPADPAHPYGHGRAESVTAKLASIMLCLTGLYIIYEALSGLAEVHQPPRGYTLWVAVAGMIIKEAMYWYAISVARRIGSTSLAADAWNHRSDVLATATVVLGLVLTLYGGEHFRVADHVAAVVVGAVILYVGGVLFWRSALELMDTMPSKEVLRAAQAAALSVGGVKRVETLVGRKTGLDYLLDIHIEVSPEMPVDQAHLLAHQVKDAICSQVKMVRDVLVHVEPNVPGEKPRAGVPREGE